MGKQSAQHKQKTHQEVLRKAGSLFRSNGYAGTGIDTVMKAVKMTAGGFYRHFESKDALFREVIADTFSKTRQSLFGDLKSGPSSESLRQIILRYISRAHRDGTQNGCMIPALAAEVSRQNKSTRAAFEKELLELLRQIEDRLPYKLSDEEKRNQAIALLALSVGAVALSRAVNEDTLSDQILLASRNSALSSSTKT